MTSSAGLSRNGAQSRPFGVALLIAGWDEAEGGGAVLYQTDPSGTFAKFSAKAIGSGSEGAQTALQARGRGAQAALRCPALCKQGSLAVKLSAPLAAKLHGSQA